MKLTFEETQELKRLALEFGFKLFWTADGEIDPAQVLGFRLGGLLGKAVEKGIEPEKLQAVLDIVAEHTGHDLKVKTLETLDGPTTKH